MTEPPIYSRPYEPKMCCERCVFGTGKHAESCNGISMGVEGYEIAIKNPALPWPGPGNELVMVPKHQ